MKTLLLISTLFLNASAFADPAMIEFHIAAGTGENAWNTPATTVEAQIGQTIRFYNDDTIVHRLHTPGVPCPHGPDFQPGTTFDCVISSPYTVAADGPLYDHNVGPSARFYLEVK
jgi:plastocyanin